MHLSVLVYIHNAPSGASLAGVGECVMDVQECRLGGGV